VKLPIFRASEGETKDSLPELVAASIRQAIFEGSLGSGVQLKQNDVAASLGVSAVPVREALKRLTAEGLLHNERNKGVVVAPLSIDDFVEITDMRLMLEPYLLRCSAPNLTEADLDAAERILAATHSESNIASHAKEHWEFHRLLYAKARRPRALAQIDVLYVSINRYLLPAWKSAGLSEHWDDSHLQITKAIRRGNVEGAAELISTQIQDAAARVMTFFERGVPIN
jgi:DNA-binding GntR family transcriptional regulator